MELYIYAGGGSDCLIFYSLGDFMHADVYGKAWYDTI